MANRKTIRSSDRLNPILSANDQAILLFLWKHRIATFEALRSIFYPDVPSEKAYYRLGRLRHGEFLKVDKMDGTRNFVWCLGARGFKYLIGNCLPELRSKTYRPQSPFHDLVVAGALLGRWGLNPPIGVSIITEQELSSIELTDLPYEFRKKIDHKPDGLWIMNPGKDGKAIALEVELSAKSSSRYEQICSFYTSQLFFAHVIWIVESKALGRRILESSRLHGIPREGVHLFIEQKDFLASGWDSKILNESMDGISLANFLAKQAGVKTSDKTNYRLVLDGSSTSPDLKKQSPIPFLNFSLTSGKLATLRKLAASKNP